MNISKITLLALALVGCSAFAMDAPAQEMDAPAQGVEAILKEEQQKALARVASITQQLALIKEREQLKAQLQALNAQVAEGNQQLGLFQLAPKPSPSLDDLVFIADGKITKDQEKETRLDQHSKQAQAIKRPIHKKKKVNASISCPKCKQTYYGELALRSLGRHMRLEYSKDLTCNICGEQERDPTKMYNHMIESHIILQCSVCGSSFRNKEDYSKHIRSSHLVPVQQEDNVATDEDPTFVL